MNESSPQAKREFYAQPHVAQGYDALRFGGASGAWVDAREVEIMMRLLGPFQRALDLGCGTGRLTRALTQRSVVIGLDSSAAMLTQAREKIQSQFIQGDAFHLPFTSDLFDAIAVLRVVFHLEDLDGFLSSVARVLKPRGVLVFDTSAWSPRAWRPLDPHKWGGRIYVHSPQEVGRAAQGAGLEIIAQEECFLFSPYVYRRLPFAVVKMLGRVEPSIPPRFRSRVFWKLMRV